jgi:hypothetical protein
MLPRPMPELWIDICYNRIGDRNEIFGKIKDHVPSKTTVFVAIVLANKVCNSMRRRLGVIGKQKIPPTISAPESSEIIPPYMAVWKLKSIDPVYYNIRRGYYIDLELAGPDTVFRFDMDIICRDLQ